MYFDSTNGVDRHFTAPEAVINLIVLAICIVLALFVLERYLRWQSRRA